MTAVTVENVVKRFTLDGTTNGREVVAINDVSFKIKSGGRIAILGPSGCGKTTLLRLIAGLEKADNGYILYDNIDLQLIEPKNRGIGMVFQEWALIPHWEARRTVGFFLKIRNREYEIPERVKEVSTITGVGINQLLDKRPRELSGGEKQRVAIARAFARDLRVLLFDEPFASLDAKFRAEARVELRRLLDEFPTTSIFVTHDQMEATALADHIILLREGKVEQIGSYTQLYENPRTLFVAQFIGTATMNIFPGKVNDGNWWGESFEDVPVRTDLANGSDVLLGIRAEHIHLQEGGTPAVVDSVVPYFAERYQLLEVWLGRERWKMQVPIDTAIEVGTTIYCALDLRHTMFFDTSTGHRIG